MKRKNLFLLLITCLTLILTVLCSCGGTVKNVTAKADKSIASATSLTQTVTVVDAGVTVYSLEKTVTVSGDDASVTLDEAKLGVDFTLQHNVTTQTSTKKEQLVLPVELSEDIVLSSSYENGKLTCLVGNDGVERLFGTSGLSVTGNVNVEYVMSNNKLQQLTCSFTTATSKTVTISVTCAY